MKAAVIGATGYTGQVLLRLLENHPKIKTIIPVSSSKTGTPLSAADPAIGKALKKTADVDSKYVSVAQAVEMEPDVVFAALPHLKSAAPSSLIYQPISVLKTALFFAKLTDKNRPAPICWTVPFSGWLRFTRKKSKKRL